MIKSRARKQAEEKPMAHQRVSLEHDKKNPVVYDTSDPGTGKTAVRIWSFAERRRKRGGCALIFGPRTILKNAWANDFAKFAPDMKVVVANADNREEAFDMDVDAYITNHDAAKWLAKKPKSFFAKFSELIIDEPTAYKHHSSQRSRAMAKIARYFKQRKGLTATPNSNTICDVWHQVYILDDGKRLGTSFYSFRNTVCEPQQVGKSKNAVNWVDKDGAEEAVFGLLSDIVIRHKFDECVDIPKTHSYIVPYDMSAKQRDVYDKMEAAQLLALMPGPGKPMPTISAVNAAAVATKLLQIASGAVYDNESKYHVVDTGRYELIMDLVEARVHPLVFFHWQHQKEQLIAEAEKRKLRFDLLDGSRTDAQREATVKAYQAGTIDVLLAHPRSAAHGLTLTRGTSTIWSSPTYDAELFQQGNKRQARIGQTKKTEIITVLAEDTIEERVYELLEGKNARMKNLLDLFHAMTADRRKK